MNKKFLFVNLSINCGFTGVNHGIAYLVPVVRKHSYEAECLNISQEITDEEFGSIIHDLDPVIVGFSCTEHQLRYLVQYSKELVKYPRILQISGGVASTLEPQWVLSRTSVNGVCVGEGEIPLDNLLDNIDRKQDIADTQGFYWRTSNTAKKALCPAFVSDLSTLDFPDYTVFEEGLVSCGGNLNIMLSRGCPFSCYHCCNAALRGVYPSSQGYFRLPSVEYSVALLERVIGQYPETRFIGFEDDLLISDKNWFERFADEYRKRINLPYRVCVRAECLDKEVVELLKHSGCRQASLGLESGNEYLRREIINRQHSNNLLIEKGKMIKAAGINLFTFNIVGFPFEGRREMKDTYELNRRIAPDSGACFFFYPYRGTQLYQICARKDLLKSEEEMLKITNYCTRPSIRMTSVQEKDCIYFQKKIWRYLVRRNCLFKISRLPSGAGKYPLAMLYWLMAILETHPLLKKAARRFVRMFGLKAFIWSKKIIMKKRKVYK